ncbi:MAG: carbon monoxide dehydrogenase subunit G [Nitratireductor sp.]|nr:carbon monoxide dehydrogenase subunit G [Nitratireductor sp.]
MKLEGCREIAGSPHEVWEAMLTEDMLCACIPGCERLERSGDNRFDAEVVIKVGPVRARFAGTVALGDLDPPRSCRIEGEGNGGAAGFAQGHALINLEPGASGTNLRYVADIKIGGRIAALGDRLFRGVVERNVTSFFDVFEARMTANPKIESSTGRM